MSMVCVVFFLDDSHAACVSVQYGYYTVRIIHLLHTIKTQHVKNKALVLLYLNTMYAPWYCCHSTQTQYHHEQSDTVIAQKGPLVTQTPDTIKTMGFISTLATHA